MLPSRPVHAHATEQGFVLLLPTDLYIAGGAAAVAATVLLLAVLPGRVALALFRPRAPCPIPRLPGRRVASLLSAVLLLGLVALGQWGPHDPTRNLLPLTIWTLLWVILVPGQGIWGDLWRRIEPWSGPHAVLTRLGRWRAPLRLPGGLGHWPAVLGFLAFAAVLLAHPAPADPGTLALMVLLYWAFHLALMLLFGPRWLRRGEGLTALMTLYARLAPIGPCAGRMRLGLPGWRWIRHRAPPAGVAALMILALGVGSFDGLNETFWWLARLGLNPLEFPGRSAILWQNLGGLALTCAALPAAYALAIRAGQALARDETGGAWRAYAPALLPIALGYHLAHYLPSLLVEGQYLLAALRDPLAQGDVHVTTGFFNRIGSVRAIWLSQAGAVVGGHVLAILMSHAIALHRLGCNRRAVLAQAPLAGFMVGYTLFGLWLLASPRGV
ncbi:hypothetical protein HMH01_10455 [Halovulum dunhuangense]|uniref:Fenitrothion hydrolase n=1 Tax=Halovulum dunhuangense TaxID=1505036 RepID=A0A849L3G5_9RHOB|nr:hypothetical protein [Halovulum dunhuangense]